MAGSPSVASRSPYPTLPSHPTDLELVDTYLRPWVKSGLKSGAFTHEADVYSDEPAVLAQKFRPLMAQQDGELAWYFYTPLRQKSVQRTVATGAGFWKIESKLKEVYKFHNDGKDHVGSRQSFCFMRKHGDKQVRSRWLMMEFSLLGDGQEAGEADALGLGLEHDLVLCKVYRSPGNPNHEPCGGEAVASPRHKAEAGDDDDRSEATQDEASDPPRKSYGKESREATMVAGDRISGAAAAAPGRKEKVQVREDYDGTSAAAATLKRKASSSPRPTLPPSHPTYLELLNKYFRPRVEEDLKPGAFIYDEDVYSADPADLTQELLPLESQDGERAWYFYTVLRQKNVHGTRKVRTVATGAGYWRKEGKQKDVYMFDNGKHHVGYRQSLSFTFNVGDKGVRSGWLMMEFSFVGDGEEEAVEDGALGHRVLCKVYRSPRYPEREAAASPGHKAEADNGGESSDATTEDDDDDVDDSSEATKDEASDPPRNLYGKESREAKLVAGYEISGQVHGCAPAATPTVNKRKADERSPRVAVPASALKKKADVSSSFPHTPVSGTEMQCPRCGAHSHLVVTLKTAKTKSETEIAKDQSAAPGAAQPDETRASSPKSNPYHGFL